MKDCVAVSMTLDFDGVGIRLVNETPGTVTILWDRCLFVDTRGRTHRVLYCGVGMSRGWHREPTPVARGQVLVGTLVARSLVQLEHAEGTTRWRVLDHLPAQNAGCGQPTTAAVHLVLIDGDGRVIELQAKIGARWDGALCGYRVPRQVLWGSFG